MEQKKILSELGKYKEDISKALFKNADIRELILGDTSGMSAVEMRKAFKERVKSHLFIEETIKDATTYIFYEVNIPYFNKTTKRCQIVMYLICHRDILDDYVKDGYYGNRADILAEMVEETFVQDKDMANKFGIGELTIDSVNFFNSHRFYGRVLTFDVPTFR